MTLLQRRLLSFLQSPAAPGYGACYRCWRPWKFTAHHTTWFTSSRGCFSLCEDCWEELTPETRLPFYRELVVHWGSDGAADWPRIKAAVEEGR